MFSEGFWQIHILIVRCLVKTNTELKCDGLVIDAWERGPCSIIVAVFQTTLLHVECTCITHFLLWIKKKSKSSKGLKGWEDCTLLDI